MEPELRANLAFHVAGERTHGATEAIDDRGLRPALLAQYRDLTALRYDYPLVLVPDDPERCIRSLSLMVDELLRATAPRGADGERLRRQVLAVEREIRARLADGASGTLSSMWQQASARVARNDAGANAALAKAYAKLGVDGELLDCGHGTARRLVTHVWRSVQRVKVRRFRDLASRLLLRLDEILRAELMSSAAGRTPDQLRAAFGGMHGDAFDFGALSEVLTRTAAAPAPASRRKRVRDALAVLEAQTFFPASTTPASEGFVFADCAEAMAAYRARLPDMRRLAKALAVAELEVDGLYVEARHDALLDRMFDRDLRPSDLAMFPDYLVCLEADHASAGEGARLLELLSAGPPVKVVVEADDLDHHTTTNGHGGFGIRCVRLASVAMGLGQVHVVQAPAASLFELRERLVAGVAGPGATLVNVFTGAARHAYDLPPYLASAAALQSRAFPAFSFDPRAGADWADRFSIDGNPQPERDWPLHALTYADREQQRVARDLPFTFADFAVCDRRRAGHFALVPGLEHAVDVPSILTVDRDARLRQVIVDEPIMLETRACADAWRSLQELGGIRNSHAEQQLAKERAAWEARAVQAPAVVAAPATEAPAAVPVDASAEAAAKPPSSDEPYIETARCTSCNECTRLNDRMFAYNGNKQAYIKDPTAGTYAQLVQAAESCQIAIIHPGKPRNPNEVGLTELVERAQAFL